MSLTLRYPKTGSPTYEVVMRNPILGNDNITDLNVLNRKTRSGEAVSVRPTGSPTIIMNRYQYKTLTKIVKDDLDEFLRLTAGLEVYLQDHNDDVWHGVVSSPSCEMITRDDTCSYDVGFDFVGVKQ